MHKRKKSVGRALWESIFRDEKQENGEDDIAEYLLQREEIALKSLQDSLRNLKKYQAESALSQNSV